MSGTEGLPGNDDPRVQRGLARMAFVAWLLDDCFRLPGTNKRFGLDGLLGLIPGAGDVLTAIVQLHLLLEAGLLGVKRETLLRMLGNVALDTVVGCVPIAGDIFDFVFKSSTYNLELARAELEDRAPEMNETTVPHAVHRK